MAADGKQKGADCVEFPQRNSTQFRLNGTTPDGNCLKEQFPSGVIGARSLTADGSFSFINICQTVKFTFDKLVVNKRLKIMSHHYIVCLITIGLHINVKLFHKE